MGRLLWLSLWSLVGYMIVNFVQKNLDERRGALKVDLPLLLPRIWNWQSLHKYLKVMVGVKVLEIQRLSVPVLTSCYRGVGRLLVVDL